MSQPIDSLYYELELRAQGMDAGKAAAEAKLRSLSQSADQTGTAFDQLRAKLAAANPGLNAAELEKGTAKFAKLAGITQEVAAAQTVVAGTSAAVAGATGKVAASAESGVMHLGRLREGFTSLFAQLTGTMPILDRTVSSFASFAASTGIVIAILAALDAIVFAYDKITSSARKAREQIDKVIEGLLKQREEELRTSTVGRQQAADIATSEETAALRRLQLAQAGHPITTAGAAIDQIVVTDPKAITAAQKEYTLAVATRIQAERELGKTSQETRDNDARETATILASGTATAFDVEQKKKHIEALKSELETLGTTNTARRAQIDALIADLEREDKAKAKSDASNAKKAAQLLEEQKRAREAFDAAIAAKTPAKEDDLNAQIARLVDGAEKAKLGAVEIQKKVADLRAAAAAGLKEQSDTLNRELALQIAKTTVTAVDDLKQELKDFDAEIAKKRVLGLAVDETVVAKLRAIKVAMIDVTGATETLAKSIKVFALDLSLGFNLNQDLAAIQPLIDAAIEARNAAPVGTVAAAAAQKNLDDLLALELELRKKLGQIKDDAIKHDQTAAELTGQIAGDIATAANAAFGLASAFLGVDNNITKALGSIGQLAGGVDAISKSTSLVGALPGIAQTIGGVLGIMAVLSAESPAEQTRLQRLKDNTEALLRLTAGIGTLAGINATGADIVRATAAMNAAAAAGLLNNSFRGMIDMSQLAAILGQVGLTVQQFVDIMKGLGITLDATSITVDELRASFLALQTAALISFGSSFAGQMEEFNAAIAIFPDLSDPIKQFQAFAKAINAIANGGGALGAALNHMDLTTAAGVAAAESVVQDLFTRLQAGTLTAADLGGMTPEQFLQALLETEKLIKAAGAGGPAGTGGFNTVQTITEVTGSRIGALLSTGNIFAEQTAQHTEAILKAFTSGATSGGATPLVAPAVTPSGGNPVNSAAISVSGGINVTVQVAAGDVADPEAFGRKIGRGIIQQISQGQATELNWRKRANGNLIR
jgi:hypothetical protein